MEECLSVDAVFRAQRVCAWVCALCSMNDLSLTLALFPSVNKSVGTDYPCLVASPCLHVGEVGREQSENIQSKAHECLRVCLAQPC